MKYLEVIVWFLVFAVIYLLIKDFRRKEKVSIETLNSDTFMEMTSNGVRFTKPVTFNSTVTTLSDLITTQIKTNEIDKNTSESIKFQLLPTGTILAFNGDTAPAGWAICDGNNSTPDLRGRFILGSGQGAGLTARVRQQTGGVEKHKLTVAEMPSHSHSYTKFPGTSGDIASDRYWAASGDRTSTEGGDQPHENMPPFYVLTYIMKL
jgi:microcystin-dependent protein